MPGYNFAEILFVLFLAAAGLQLFWYLFVFPAMLVPARRILNTTATPVSVIVCARNEEENLRAHLPVLLQQDYPDYEVIIVDDSSDDGTELLLKQMQQKYKHLRCTRLNDDKKFKHGKKLALTVGIKAASNQLLLLTDADCCPVSDQWVRSFAQRYTQGKEIVLGYGGYERKPGLLDKIVRLDTLSVAANYLSAARIGLPYMGVGRNLSYKKELFFKNKGFASHYKMLSGDDDLFISEVAKKANCTVLVSKDSFTRSKQVDTLRDWRYQKRRHLSTSKEYRFFTKLFLAAEPVSRIAYFLLGISLFFAPLTQTMLLTAAYAAGGRQILQLAVTKLNMAKLGERNLLLYSPLFDIAQPAIYAVFFVNNYFAKGRKKWK
jgi:poly-beta-1,6-N-acetyl-D-glucosamine synthase